MLIDCPSCARSYHVSRAEIGESGRAVICPRCEASWIVDGDGMRRDPQPGPAEILTTVVSARPTGPMADVVAPRPSLIRRAAPAIAACACVAFAMGVIGARESVVRLAPRMAGLYAAAGLPVNVRGLAFSDVESRRVDAQSADVVVKGEIRNVAQGRVRVPRLAFDVRDSAGVSVAAWTEAPPARSLAADAMVSFVSRPHALPPDGRTMVVRFEGGFNDAAPRSETLASR
jgi:predicted Zn finger-like uncharacterized protein